MEHFAAESVSRIDLYGHSAVMNAYEQLEIATKSVFMVHEDLFQRRLKTGEQADGNINWGCML